VIATRAIVITCRSATDHGIVGRLDGREVASTTKVAKADRSASATRPSDRARQPAGAAADVTISLSAADGRHILEIC